MDKLDEIFKKQLEFDSKFLASRGYKNTLYENQKWTKEYVLALLKECSEVLDNINWKTHRKDDHDVIESNIIEELVDVQKYLVNIVQLWGYSSEDFYNEFVRKSDVVESRWKLEHQLDLLEDKNVVALDLDGVLCKYHEYMLRYVNWELGTVFKSYLEMKRDCPVDLYERLKDKYRREGAKLNIPINDNAKEFCESLKKMGYTIIILTARPYKKYTRIFADTIEWLKKKEIKYDGIIFSGEKHLEVIKKFPNLKFIVEDDSTAANTIAKMGKGSFLLMTLQNEHDYIDPRVVRIKNLMHILNAKIGDFQ